MPVGTGSLQRAAAKASGAAEDQKKGRVKNAAAKETAAKKETAPKKMETRKRSKVSTAYHLTEDLPYYLL